MLVRGRGTRPRTESTEAREDILRSLKRGRLDDLTGAVFAQDVFPAQGAGENSGGVAAERGLKVVKVCGHVNYPCPVAKG